jgi:hypothetical protein
MTDSEEQNDSDLERTGEHAAAPASEGGTDGRERSRTQAARVRESLMRCPGSAGV